MVQFRDPAAVGDEMEAWRLWHSRQPSFKQRILDIGNAEFVEYYVKSQMSASILPHKVVTAEQLESRF